MPARLHRWASIGIPVRDEFERVGDEVKTQVIVLNGSSSCGKTTIARCLKAILPTPWISLSIDDLLRALPPSLMDSDAGIAFGEHGEVTIGEGFRRDRERLAGRPRSNGPRRDRGSSTTMSFSPELNRRRGCGHIWSTSRCCGSACTATPRLLRPTGVSLHGDRVVGGARPLSRSRFIKGSLMTSRWTPPRLSRWISRAPSLSRCLRVTPVRCLLVPGSGGTALHGGCFKSFGFECPHRQHRRNRCSAFPKAIEHKSGIHERAQQSGQRQVRCPDLLPEPRVRPRRLRPVTIEIAGTDDDGLRISAVGKTATEARVNADVNEATARSDNSPSLPEDGGIVRYISVNHDGNHT